VAADRRSGIGTLDLDRVEVDADGVVKLDAMSGRLLNAFWK